MTVRITFNPLTQYAPLTVHAPDEAASLLAGGCGCEETPALAHRPEVWAVAEPEAPAGTVTWSGVIGMEGELTGDGRLIEPNALRWEDLPIPLRHAPEDTGGHQGAVVVGRILSIERGEGGKILATGDFDMDSREGQEAARQVDRGLTPGISMDLDSVSFEVRVAKELLDGGLMLDMPEVEDGEVPAKEVDEDGRVKVMEIGSDDEVMVTTEARIRAATVVAIPAFAGARIALDSPLSEAPAPTLAAIPSPFARMEEADPEAIPDGATCSEEDCNRAPTHLVFPNDEPTEDEEGVLFCEEHAAEAVAEVAEDEAEGDDDAPPFLAAGAGPVEPPQAWFDNPDLPEPTPLTVTSDGRVYGHLAIWGTCHTAYTGQCVEPPHSRSGYAYFRTGAVLTAEGSEVPVGRLTIDTLHAGKTMSAAATLAHYEHTGKAVADVAAGEDVHGIWVAGAIRPDATPEQVRALRASPLSGDWRRVGSSLELVGALAVNVPGFPVPRPQGLVASGVMQSLVASGMLPPAKVIAPGLPGALTEEDLRYLKALARREKQAEQEQALGVQDAAAALAERVRATRVHAMARRLTVVQE